MFKIKFLIILIIIVSISILFFKLNGDDKIIEPTGQNIISIPNDFLLYSPTPAK